MRPRTRRRVCLQNPKYFRCARAHPCAAAPVPTLAALCPCPVLRRDRALCCAAVPSLRRCVRPIRAAAASVLSAMPPPPFPLLRRRVVPYPLPPCPWPPPHSRLCPLLVVVSTMCASARRVNELGWEAASPKISFP
jgi:hypothetical protein